MHVNFFFKLKSDINVCYFCCFGIIPFLHRPQHILSMVNQYLLWLDGVITPCHKTKTDSLKIFCQCVLFLIISLSGFS